ncbi:rho GTPase-activating protein 7-like [Ambystoma mexicanum]|uniref:rho GTPase-activating protein 7-like n=1 Tax=Ambystoma mexicanum TaxID=8296 RepID=UPI0037E7755C
MSLAVRKKSWEEHVTRWTGLPFGSTEHDPKCSHGIVADKLMSNMEKEDCLMVDRKEKCASLPEYLHGEDLEGCHAKLLGSTSREACENGQNEGQEQLLPLETSTETLVHISDEESELSYQSAEDGHLRRDGHSPDGAVPLEEIVSSNVWVSHSSSEVGSVGEDPCSALATEAREEKEKEELEISTENSNGQEIFSDLHSNAAMGTPQERISNASYVMEVRALSDQLLCTADFTQPHSKPSGLKDVQEKAVCDVDPESLLLDVCRDGEGAPSPDTRNDLVMPNLGPGCLLDRIKPENMGYKQPPMLCYKESRSMESFQDFQAKDKPAPHEHGYSLVTLRKRKETRKERDRSRLDSMVLLIMKLDQLDQDIENALTTGTSPTGTPVLKRRHMPDLESGSESGSDIAAVHQSTKTVSPGMDAEQGLQVANCGAKPKAAVTPGTSEKEKAGEC